MSVYVVSSGAPVHAENLARQAGWEFQPHKNPGAWYYDADLVIVGLFQYDLITYSETYYRKHSVFPFFIGSDVLYLKELEKNNPELAQAFIYMFNQLAEEGKGHVFAVSPNLVRELHESGIEEVICCPFVPDFKEVDFTPEGNRVAVYLPPGEFKRRLFCLDYLNQYLGKRDYPCTFFVDSTYEGKFTQSEKAHYTSDFEQILREAAVNIRLSLHDGWPQSVIGLAFHGIPTITTSANEHYAQDPLLTISVRDLLDSKHRGRVDKQLDKALKYALDPKKSAPLRQKLQEDSLKTYDVSQMVSFLHEKIGGPNV